MCPYRDDTLQDRAQFKRGHTGADFREKRRVAGGVSPGHCVTTNTPAIPAARQSFLNSCPENIINILVDMKSSGYSEYTLNFVSKALSFLAKHADLNDTETVQKAQAASLSFPFFLLLLSSCGFCSLKWELATPFQLPRKLELLRKTICT
jgi:hypothetical protein